MFCDFVLAKQLLNKASGSHFTWTISKNREIILEKTCFKRGFGFKDISFIKKNVDGASKTKTSQEDLTSIWLSSSYHMEWKIFIEVSFSNKIHTRGFFFFFCSCYFIYSFKQSKNLVVYFGLWKSFLVFQRRED